MLISARYGIHGLNPRYALRVCSSGRAAVTAAAATKARERGIGARGGRAGERKGREMAAEHKGRRGRKRTTRRNARHISCRAASSATREREIFFAPGRPLRVVINVFNPGL
jgi:hypothetical protein